MTQRVLQQVAHRVPQPLVAVVRDVDRERFGLQPHADGGRERRFVLDDQDTHVMFRAQGDGQSLNAG